VIPTLSPGTSPVPLEKYNKYKHQGGHEHVVLFCDTLDQYGVTPKKVFKGLDSQAPTVTTLPLSTHSSWPPPNSGLAQFAVTVMPMPIPTLVTMPQALLHPMIVTAFLLPLWGAHRVCFVSLYISSGFIRGGHVTHNLSSLPGLAS
jgi:hypothetical protein